MKLLQGKKSGITLIEALIVFAAGVGLIAAGLKLYSNLQNSGNIKDETTNISNIIKRMGEIFGEDDMTEVMTSPQTVIDAGVFAPGTKIIGADVFNKWNGRITLDDTGVSTWSLTYTRVPLGDACLDLVNNTKNVGFDRIQITSDSSIDLDVSDITSTILSAACADGGALNEATIVWINE